MIWRNRKGLIWLGVAGVVGVAMASGWLLAGPRLPTGEELVVYKSASCQCCGAWVRHMEQHGFAVRVKNVEDLTAVKQQLGVPSTMTSCHTGVVGGYLVEGHVPAAEVRRLLASTLPVKGIAVPGMPVGSPGMEIPGERPDPYQVVTFTASGQTQVMANY